MYWWRSNSITHWLNCNVALNLPALGGTGNWRCMHFADTAVLGRILDTGACWSFGALGLTRFEADNVGKPVVGILENFLAVICAAASVPNFEELRGLGSKGGGTEEECEEKDNLDGGSHVAGVVVGSVSVYVEVVSVGVLCVGVCRRRSVCVTTSFLFFLSRKVGMQHEIAKTSKTSEK